jgi:hypothetical protein
LVLGFDCVPSFHSGEVVSRRARVQSQVERSEPKGNLDGFLARLHDSRQNEGKVSLSRFRARIQLSSFVIPGGNLVSTLRKR